VDVPFVKEIPSNLILFGYDPRAGRFFAKKYSDEKRYRAALARWRRLIPEEGSERAERRKKCPLCKGGPLRKADHPDRIAVAGHVFAASLPVVTCETCGEGTTAGADLERFERAVALALAERGKASGEAFRFMRKASGLAANDLAALLGTTPETISRWETGKRPLDPVAWRALALLVREVAEGSTAGLAMLRASLKAKPLPRRVALKLAS
jgi:putative zinc finger/helix-turn-helix YgiT family protein